MFRRVLPSNGMVMAVLLVAVFACGFGALFFGDLFGLSEAEQERIRMEAQEWKERAEAERPAAIFWAWAWRVALALAMVGVVGVVLLFGVRWALTIAPNRQGIFPLLLGRIGGAWVVYDPNRSPTAATSLGDGDVKVTYALPDGLDQAQVTGRAQAVQAMAALSTGEGTGSKAGELAGQVLGIGHQLTVKPMPEVKRSPWKPSHIERLLVESGALEEGYE